MAKKELILNVAGVLATNFSPLFWQELSVESNTPYEDLSQFRKEMREELWTGKIPVEGFWNQLCKKFPAINRDKAKESFFQIFVHCQVSRKYRHGANTQISIY